MELFVFIVFQFLMEVQSYKSPTVKVSPDVIRESSSVKISCETPADVIVNQCYFYTNREEKNIKVSSSCELDLSGAEVLRWAAVKSPESIYINCYYTIHERGIDKPSPHSPPATVTVLDSLPKPFISVTGDDDILSCEIPLSVRADFICSLYTEDDVLLDQRVSQRSRSGENLCMFYLSRSELFTRSVNSRRLICVYSLKTQPEIRSPHRDTYTIRVSTTTTATEQTTATAMKTWSTVMSTTETTTYSTTAELTVMSTSDSTTYSKTESKTSMTKETMLSTAASNQKAPQMNTVISTEIPVSCRTDAPNVPVTHIEGPPTPQYKDIWFIVLVFTGVAAILSGLMGLFCLCQFSRKKRRKRNTRRSIKPDVASQGIGMSCSGSAETYSVITSVPAASQPISADLKHPESHQDSTADPTDTHSIITSVNPIYQPSDVLVNKPQKGGNPEENENVDHPYSTIPYKPVHSNAGDQIYSLVKMH